MVESGSYREILQKLRFFIRKYYLNKTLQGVLLCILIFLLVGGLMILGNQGFRADVSARTTELRVAGLIMILLLAWLILLPLLQFLGVGRRLNYKRAEMILSRHFAEMKDTLLNILELAEEFDDSGDNSLLLASIEEKAEKIKWYRFGRAVPIRRLIRFVPMFAGIVLVGSLIYFVWPDFVREGYARTINYNVEFDLPPVYEYEVLNDSLSVAQGRDLEVRIRPRFERGEENVYLRIGQNREQMTVQEEDVLTYRVRALNGSTTFRLQYRGIISDPYEIKVLPTPEMVRFNLQTYPPAYTRIESQVLNNEGDLDIPKGTTVVWNINAIHTEKAMLGFEGDTVPAEGEGNSFTGRKRLLESGRYKIILSNKQTAEKAEISYNIRVRPDLYPEIDVNEIRDSVLQTQFFFQGFISDDYGFSKLEFNVEGVDGTLIHNEELMVNNEATNMRYYHARDMEELGHEGEQLYYYFSVWDNDGVNGAKRTDSRKLAYRNLTYSELVQQNKERAENIEEAIEIGKEITEKLSDKVEDLKVSQLMEEEEDWETKSKIKEMEEMQGLLEEMLENIKEDNVIKDAEQDRFDLENQRLLQKQEEIQDLLEKIMDDELKQLLEEFEKLLEEMNKGKKLEMLDEIEMNLEKLERQLDVSLELLKRYEVEKEVFRTANELEKLAEKLENSDINQDGEELEDIQEEYEELSDNYEEQIEKNNELQEPMEMEDYEEERKEISEEMEKMNSEDSSDSQKKQKKSSAAQKMKEMASNMKGMMMAAGGEQDQVDLEMLRQIMRELNDYSFKQEELMEIVDRINISNPEYIRVGVEERELSEKFDVIKDTLISIGRKQPMIAKLLNMEMFHVETALENLMDKFQNENQRQFRIGQQNVMTGVNELAVRLDEMVQGLEMQGAGAGGGKQEFTDSNPKSGKDKVGDMQQQQQSLKEQLEGMIQKMKQGNKGQRDKEGLARQLAEREMMRQAMEKLKNSGELGQEAQKKLSEAQKIMEEIEKDIIYDRLGDHTIRREKQIETRLLEAEQAEMEREKDNVREAEEFKGTMKAPDLEIWEEFEKKKKRSLELMRYRDIKLKEFYRKKYFDYLEQLEKNKR